MENERIIRKQSIDNRGELKMKQRELYHYGIPGMKWGVRKARRKEARALAKESRKVVNESGLVRSDYDRYNGKKIQRMAFREANKALKKGQQYDPKQWANEDKLNEYVFGKKRSPACS